MDGFIWPVLSLLIVIGLWAVSYRAISQSAAKYRGNVTPPPKMRNPGSELMGFAACFLVAWFFHAGVGSQIQPYGSAAQAFVTAGLMYMAYLYGDHKPTETSGSNDESEKDREKRFNLPL